jgi:3-(methylthio)propionyl---CoA ligase
MAKIKIQGKNMQGLMQDYQLLISRFIDFAARFHGDVELVTLAVEGGTHRYNYRECNVRSKKLSQALQKLGCGEGDCIATFAWNTNRHMELWYGISGMGAVCHTVNPRLFAEQLVYIFNHAEDKIICLDTTFVPVIEAIQDQLEHVQGFIILTDEANMPETSLKNVHCYESLLAAEDGEYDWPEFDENTGCSLCYTSGTTGNPKGVLYSHRSNYLHTMASLSADVFGITARDCFLPVVPMFHANAWGAPYACAAVGAKIVMNGPNFEGDVMHDLIVDEGVTATAAVPTIWLMLLNYLKETGETLDCLKRVTIGGAAAPRFMIEAFERDYGVEVVHAWGMTETSPLGTICVPNRATQDLHGEALLDLKCKQGRPMAGVELKIIDDEGNELPRDGAAFGHLMIKGPWVSKAYFKQEGGNILDADGWFDTGDVATIDENGFMQITDRSKDVIKSGGEWISSIELENAAVGHPDVAEAGVIGISHPKWDERPLLILVMQEGKEVDRDSIMGFLKDKVAKWWLPDDIVTIDELPHTATGKILKTALREKFGDYKFPTA